MLGSSIFRYESNSIKNVKFWAVFWKLWSIIQSKVRSDAQSASEVCSSLFFLKTVSFGKEIIFFVYAGFFNFSIQIQRYKERKILGSILKVMINYSVKCQKRCESASELCSPHFFLKIVSFGKEINFFVHFGFFNFSIRIQWYKERKILGGILKVMQLFSQMSKVTRNPRVRCVHRSFSLKLYLLARN